MDLVREILLRAEAAGYNELRTADLVSAQHDERTVAEHFYLLQKAGLAEANLYTLQDYGALHGTIERLTPEGHDFLQAVKNDTVWGRIKDEVRKNGGTWTMGILKAMGAQLLNEGFGL